MFTKGDIVMLKGYDDKTCKSYKRLQYVVVYVNKGNGKVWIRPLVEKMRYFYWSRNPNYLIKVSLTQ